MNKDTKILIIGFGSIGKRHWRNLIKLGFKNVFVYEVDKSKLAGQKIKILSRLEKGALKGFKIALICSPNNFHVSHALMCVKAGCHPFIEKPLSHNLNGIAELEKLCREKRIITMVGCNLRFHPCLRFIKKFLERRGLGPVYSLAFEFGYYLPYWRPGQDYRKNYAAKKSAGGGIILDDIHEFDLLFWFSGFSAVVSAKWLWGKLSDLQIQTEDVCLAAFKFKNGAIGSVSCDYLQQDYTRRCKIVGKKGNLEWDFKENVVWLKNRHGRKKLFGLKRYDFNRTYLDEIEYFLSCAAKGRKTFNDINLAAKTLELCLKRKENNQYFA